MIYLIQILKMLKKQNNENIDLFEGLFCDLSFEINEMGYKDHECELVNEMLLNHFGMSIESEFQLKELTKCILDENKFKLSLKTFEMV